MAESAAGSATPVEPNIFPLTARFSGWVNSVVGRIVGTVVFDPNEQKNIGTCTSHDQKRKNKFDMAEVTMPEGITRKYDIGPVIGKGSNCIVLECTIKHTDKKYALKVYKPSVHKNLEKGLENEISLLHSLCHPNILCLYDDFRGNDFIFEIFEFVNGAKHFKHYKKYKEDDARGMLYNLVSALEYLHSKNIVHCDVNLINILITKHEDGAKSLKLVNFSSALKASGPSRVVSGSIELKCLVGYVAPELLELAPFGLKIDVWSAGVIAYALLSGRLPFISPTRNTKETSELILAAKYNFPEPAWKDVSDSAKSLVRGMLTKDQSMRFSASQVLDHPWMSSSDSSDKKASTKFRRRYRAIDMK